MKHYSPSDEVRLIEAVEEQGGRYLDRRCMANEIDALAGKGLQPAMSTGCEEDALFAVAFDPTETVQVNEPILENDPSPDAPMERKRAKKEGGEILYNVVERKGAQAGETQFATVCANDDLMRLWPRFAEHMEDRDPLMVGP